MVHLTKLVDATHILCSTHISLNMVDEAEHLLHTFCNDFENLYGEINTVFNVHLLRHLAECVRNIGPLFTYSNYNFEDQIGHLVSLHKGTTDVATQICEKYLLEKNIFKFIVHSPIAKQFIDDIDSKQKFSIAHKVEGSLVIGNAKTPSQLSLGERFFIFSSLNVNFNIQIDEYGSVLLNSKIFYEKYTCRNKRTSDSFVFCSDNNKFGRINCIFVFQNKLYFLIDEIFEIIDEPKNNSKFIFYLREINCSKLRVVESKYISSKFVFIKFDDTVACSKFPNMYERN